MDATHTGHPASNVVTQSAQILQKRAWLHGTFAWCHETHLAVCCWSWCCCCGRGRGGGSPRSQSRKEMWLTGEKYDWLATWSRLEKDKWLTDDLSQYDWRRRYDDFSQHRRRLQRSPSWIWGDVDFQHHLFRMVTALGWHIQGVVLSRIYIT